MTASERRAGWQVRHDGDVEQPAPVAAQQSIDNGRGMMRDRRHDRVGRATQPVDSRSVVRPLDADPKRHQLGRGLPNAKM